MYITAQIHMHMHLQNASDDSSPLEYLRDSGIIAAVQEREVNLSAPIYLLSAAVNRLGRRRVNPQVTEVGLQACNIIIVCFFNINMQLLLTVGSSLLDIPQTDRDSRLESLEVYRFFSCLQNKHNDMHV